MEPAKELLFVYGTLRRGASRGGYAARLEAEAEWLSAAQTPGRLYQVNPDYPGMVKADNSRDWVTGEVWAIDDPQLWMALDDYEGTEYVRARCLVTLADGEEREAWVYLYASKITTAMAIVAV